MKVWVEGEKAQNTHPDRIERHKSDLFSLFFFFSSNCLFFKRRKEKHFYPISSSILPILFDVVVPSFISLFCVCFIYVFRLGNRHHRITVYTSSIDPPRDCEFREMNSVIEWKCVEIEIIIIKNNNDNIFLLHLPKSYKYFLVDVQFSSKNKKE